MQRRNLRRSPPSSRQPGATPFTPAPKVKAPENFKPRRQISARLPASKPYLETREDVDEYLAALRQAARRGHRQQRPHRNPLKVLLPMASNRNVLKKYAPQARLDFIQAMTNRAAQFGITKGGKRCWREFRAISSS
jgi:hypothetical protein